MVKVDCSLTSFCISRVLHWVDPVWGLELSEATE